MHGSVINVPANVDQTQSILSHLPHDGVTIYVLFKWHFEYKSPYMPRNVYPNIVMGALQDLIETPLYKYLNVSIHHQWVSLFTLHINWESQIPTFVERLSDSLIKALHTLHASKLNCPNKIKDLQSVHIVKLIRIDPITCVKYYDHKTSCFRKVITNYHYLFGNISIFFSSLNSKIVGGNMTMDFYG